MEIETGDRVRVIASGDKRFGQYGEVVQVSSVAKQTVWVKFAGNCVSAFPASSVAKYMSLAEVQKNINAGCPNCGHWYWNEIPKVVGCDNGNDQWVGAFIAVTYECDGKPSSEGCEHIFGIVKFVPEETVV